MRGKFYRVDRVLCPDHFFVTNADARSVCGS